MQDRFFAGLENLWFPRATAPGGQKYDITVFGSYGIVRAIATIVYPESKAAEAQVVTLGDPSLVTDQTVNSLFEDLTRVVHHYGQGYKELYCDATFGDMTRKFGWFVEEVIKERSLE